MKKVKISVAMACYNSEKFIATSIKSIFKQKYKEWELIIVDDCSTDNSINIIEDIIKKNKLNKIKLLKHNKNYGYGKTLRDAVDNSDGDLVAIIDSDDALATNNAFDIMVKQHLKYPKASLVYSNYYKCDSKLRKITKGPSRQLKDNESYINTKIRISHLKVFKKCLYNKTDGINSSLRKCVDKDLTLRLEEVGKLIYIPDILYLYRCHKNNLTKSFHRKSKKYRTMINRMRKQIYIDAKKRRGIL